MVSGIGVVQGAFWCQAELTLSICLVCLSCSEDWYKDAEEAAPKKSNNNNNN